MQLACYEQRDFVLNVEDVIDGRFIGLCPLVEAGRHVDELDVEPDAIADSAELTFEDVLHSEKVAQGPDVLLLICERP